MTIAHYAFHSRTDARRLTYADLLDLSRALGAVIRNSAKTVSWTGRAAAKAFWGWYRYRQTVAALAALDAHTLHDIGLNRSEIHAAARFGGKYPGADYRISRFHIG